tara:strand:- start:533 stop:748 length:216 start_codon:yes stop_codon:yes gene_type:complete
MHKKPNIMTTQKIEMTGEQLNELEMIKFKLIYLYNTKETPDFTLIRKVDNLVDKLNESRIKDFTTSKKHKS